MSKVLAFAAAPKNPLVSEPRGALTGISGECHWEKVSGQLLYVYETPKDAPPAPPPPYPPLPSANDDFGAGLHRAGLSLKADAVVGLYADALYTVNPRELKGVEGLSAAAGIDYSFAPREPQPYFQTLVVMAEYLYSGAASQTAAYYGGLYSGRHYLSPAVTYQATNYTSLTVSGLIALDDGSFVPILSFKHTLSQGLDLTLTAQAYPLETGEFGRESTRGQAASVSAKVSARF